MGLMNSLRKLAGLPLVETGRLLAMLHGPSAPLFRAAYAIDGSSGTAVQAWAAMVNTGRADEAQQWAARCWSRRPDRMLAGLLGLSAADAGDRAAAEDCLARGRESTRGDDELLDVLEWRLLSDQPDEVFAPFLERLERRRDLPPQLAQLVLIDRMWRELRDGRRGRAEALADRLLAVGADPHASTVKWALAEIAGRSDQAAGHLAATASLPQEMQLYLQCLGLSSIGRRDEAAALIEQLRTIKPELADQASGLCQSRRVGIAEQPQEAAP